LTSSARLADAEQTGAGEPGVRDRLAIHLVWEVLLLVLAVVFVRMALAATPEAHLADIFRPAGYLGLIAAGFALSLRTGTPNLAVGAIATGTGILGAHLASADGWSLWVAMMVAVAAAAATGLAAGLVVAVLSVPSWAVTLSVALMVTAVDVLLYGSAPAQVKVSGAYPAGWWLLAFAMLSLGGGALWLVPGVRTALSASREAREPGQRAGLPAALGAVAGLTGSSMLAGIGGVALMTFDLYLDPGASGADLTLAALAAALIGGVSVFGRRAGVAGTALGVVMVQTTWFLMAWHDARPAWYDLTLVAMVLFGLGVSRAVESITNTRNKPAPA
jgi:ribose/xylose/arabinose/galactoside ABC-type transport system permease subunit